MGKNKSQKKAKREKYEINKGKLLTMYVLSCAARRLQTDNIISTHLSGLFEVICPSKNDIKYFLEAYLPGLYLCRPEQRSDHVKLIITLNHIKKWIQSDQPLMNPFDVIFSSGQIKKTQQDFVRWAKKVRDDDFPITEYYFSEYNESGKYDVRLATHRICAEETEILSLVYYYCFLDVDLFITSAMLTILNDCFSIECDTPDDFFCFYKDFYSDVAYSRYALLSVEKPKEYNASDLIGNDKKMKDLFRRSYFELHPEGTLNHIVSPSDIISVIARQSGLPVVEFVGEMLTSKKDKLMTAYTVDTFMDCYTAFLSNRRDESLTEDNILPFKSVLSPNVLKELTESASTPTARAAAIKCPTMIPERLEEKQKISEIIKVDEMTEADNVLRHTNYEYALFCKLLMDKYVFEIKSQVETSLFKQNTRKNKNAVDPTVVADLSKKLMDCEKENQKLKENNDKLYNNLISAKNREAAIIGRYETLESEYLRLKDKYEQHISEIENLDSPDMQETAEEIETTTEILNNSKIPDNYSEQLTEYFKEKKIIIIGGHVNLNNKFSLAYPDVSILRMDRIATCDAAIKGADAILFKSNYIGHGLYRKTKTLAQKNNIPFGYIDNVNSVENMAKSIYLELNHIFPLAE